MTNGPNKRLDRLERIVLQVAQSQAKLTRTVQSLAQIQRQSQRETAQRFKDTDEKLNTLVKVVDSLIRREGRR